MPLKAFYPTPSLISVTPEVAPDWQESNPVREAIDGYKGKVTEVDLKEKSALEGEGCLKNRCHLLV